MGGFYGALCIHLAVTDSGKSLKDKGMSEVKGFLTTHVLDTAKGCPAHGIPVSLYKITATGKELLARAVTNSDGRCDNALLTGAAFECARYELVFSVEEYFSEGNKGSEASVITEQKLAFLDEITIRFAIADVNDHYHIPLLVSPYSYSTYRGS